jgi:hypothetical protein
LIKKTIILLSKTIKIKDKEITISKIIIKKIKKEKN